MSLDRLLAIACGMLLAGVIMTVNAGESARGNTDRAVSIVEQQCAGCHGLDGNSPVPNFPKLAGQHEGYLVHEMEEYKSRQRDNDMMSPLMQDLSAQDMAILAAYFARQIPSPGVVNNPELLKLGKRIYLEGNPDRGVPACDGCHEGDGHGSPRFPRVAGQNVEYSIEQFNLYAHGGRRFGRKIMRVVAEKLTPEDIRAVVEYMASMP
jgi:cytochrome c553